MSEQVPAAAKHALVMAIRQALLMVAAALKVYADAITGSD